MKHQNYDVISMQFIADVVSRMSEEGYITKKDLYTLNEDEVINRIKNCKDTHVSECFRKFENTETINDYLQFKPKKYAAFDFKF